MIDTDTREDLQRMIEGREGEISRLEGIVTALTEALAETWNDRARIVADAEEAEHQADKLAERAANLERLQAITAADAEEDAVALRRREAEIQLLRRREQPLSVGERSMLYAAREALEGAGYQTVAGREADLIRHLQQRAAVDGSKVQDLQIELQHQRANVRDREDVIDDLRSKAERADDFEQRIGLAIGYLRTTIDQPTAGLPRIAFEHVRRILEGQR